MVFVCVVPGCKHRRNKDDNRSFHSFPVKSERRQKWIKHISRENQDGTRWEPTKYSRVCSDHFLPFDFVDGPGVYTNKHLKESAVPSQFPSYLQHKQASLKPSRSLPKLHLPLNVVTSSGFHIPDKATAPLPAQKVTLDHAYSGPSVAKQLERANAALAQAKNKLKQKQLEINLLKRKLQRREVHHCRN